MFYIVSFIKKDIPKLEAFEGLVLFFVCVQEEEFIGCKHQIERTPKACVGVRIGAYFTHSGLGAVRADAIAHFFLRKLANMRKPLLRFILSFHCVT